MGELRLWKEIRRCRFVISRSASENIRNRLGIRTVITSQGQDAIRNSLSYANSFDFVVALRNLCQGLLKFGIECGLKYRTSLTMSALSNPF